MRIEYDKHEITAKWVVSDMPYFRLKGTGIYALSIVIDDETTLEQVTELFEEAETLPVFDGDYEYERALVEEIENALKQPPPEDAIDWSHKLDWLQAGTVVRYDGLLYEVVTLHKSAANRTPSMTPSLYSQLGEEGSGDIIPDWVKSVGGVPAYKVGDKVLYKGTVYICTKDGTTKSPEDGDWKKEK